MKCAPDRTHDVDRAGSAVDRFRAKHLVQMIDNDDSTPCLFRYADKAVEAGADFVGGVDLTVPDIRGKRVKDQHPCARLSDSGEIRPSSKVSGLSFSLMNNRRSLSPFALMKRGTMVSSASSSVVW